jgi:hypothetical protein
MAATTMRILIEKIEQYVPLLMVFGLACWAMWNGTPLGAYIALGFAIFAHLWHRSIRGDRHGNDGRQAELPP